MHADLVKHLRRRRDPEQVTHRARDVVRDQRRGCGPQTAGHRLQPSDHPGDDVDTDVIQEVVGAGHPLTELREDVLPELQQRRERLVYRPVVESGDPLGELAGEVERRLRHPLRHLHLELGGLLDHRRDRRPDHPLDERPDPCRQVVPQVLRALHHPVAELLGELAHLPADPRQRRAVVPLAESRDPPGQVGPQVADRLRDPAAQQAGKLPGLLAQPRDRRRLQPRPERSQPDRHVRLQVRDSGLGDPRPELLADRQQRTTDGRQGGGVQPVSGPQPNVDQLLADLAQRSRPAARTEHRRELLEPGDSPPGVDADPFEEPEHPARGGAIGEVLEPRHQNFERRREPGNPLVSQSGDRREQLRVGERHQLLGCREERLPDPAFQVVELCGEDALLVCQAARRLSEIALRRGALLEYQLLRCEDLLLVGELGDRPLHHRSHAELRLLEISGGVRRFGRPVTELGQLLVVLPLCFLRRFLGTRQLERVDLALDEPELQRLRLDRRRVEHDPVLADRFGLTTERSADRFDSPLWAVVEERREVGRHLHVVRREPDQVLTGETGRPAERPERRRRVQRLQLRLAEPCGR